MKFANHQSGPTGLFALAAAVLVAACGGPAGAPGMEIRVNQTELSSPNGRSPNGRSINGRSPNGTSLDGLYVASIEWTKAKRDGQSIPGLTLSRTVFTDKSSGSEAPSNLDGVIFEAKLTDDSTVSVRLDSPTTLPAPNSDVTAYVASYESDQGWEPLCGYEPDGSPDLAIPLNGWFHLERGDHGGKFEKQDKKFMLACRHFAAAKCFEMGYKPWLKIGDKNGADYLQTCTRVLRADYCGDGTSYTVDGTLINLYDHVGVQDDTETWRAEAEWGPNGAICVGPEANARFQNTSSKPPCYDALISPTCGSGFGKTSLMIDEYVKN